jgi:hypothetical protein
MKKKPNAAAAGKAASIRLSLSAAAPEPAAIHERLGALASFLHERKRSARRDRLRMAAHEAAHLTIAFATGGTGWARLIRMGRPTADSKAWRGFVQSWGSFDLRAGALAGEIGERIVIEGACEGWEVADTFCNNFFEFSATDRAHFLGLDVNEANASAEAAEYDFDAVCPLSNDEIGSIADNVIALLNRHVDFWAWAIQTLFRQYEIREEMAREKWTDLNMFTPHSHEKETF